MKRNSKKSSSSHFYGSFSQSLRAEGEFVAEEEDAGAIVFEVTEAVGG